MSDSGWWRFWSAQEWKRWRAERGPWREYRIRAGFLGAEISTGERNLSSTRTELAKTTQSLEWAKSLAPQEVPIQIARAETGLGSVPGVALMETRRREGSDVWVPIDYGSLYLTDRKAVFSGSKNVEFHFDKLQATTQTDQGLQVAVSSRKRTHILAGPALRMEAMIVGARSFASGDSPTAPYDEKVVTLAAQVSEIERALDVTREQRAGLVAPPRPVSPAWAPASALLFFLVVGSAIASPSDTTDAVVLAATTTTAAGTQETATTAKHEPSTTASTPDTTASSSTASPSSPVDPLVVPIAAGLSGDPGEAVPPSAETVHVEAVTDGDTLRVTRDDGSSEPLRLIGTNTPEGGECFATEAGLTLAALTPVGSEIAITSDVSDRDQFDRLLRYVWVGGASVNEELVRRGVAISRRYEPDTSLAERFEQAQENARSGGLGLWAPDACGPPSDASVRIVEVNYDAPGDDNNNLNEEWVRIGNDGLGLVDLSGWSIKDESASHRFSFPSSFVLAASETVTIRTGCGDNFGTTLFWCSVGSAVWNNSGDTAFLLDPNGNTHDTHSYAPPATTTTTTQPATTTQPPSSGGNCDPSYPDVCIPPKPPDLNCGDISHRRFTVIGSDPHGFDGDNDGVGCES